VATKRGSDNRFSLVRLTYEDDTPSTPPADEGHLVAGVDKVLRWIDDDGTVTELGAPTTIDYGEDADIADLAFSDVADGGALDEVARADHVHGMPANPGGGGGGSDNEAAASVLTNATATGDAGGRADHFPGTSLGGAWTSEATAETPTVKYSSMAIDTIISGGSTTNHQVQAFTPSGAFRIEARMWLYTPTNLGSVGLLVRDSGSGDASGNGMAALLTAQTPSSPTFLRLLSLDSGTYTSRQSINTNLTSIPVTYGWFYLYIARDGSNNWTCGISYDRVGWFPTASHAKTFTVAKAGFRFGAALGGADFFDVVS